MAEKHIADAESEFIVSNVTPDFCRVGKDIVPFDICQVLTPERVDYTKSVFARGQKVLLVGSVVKGVEGNAGKGVKSQVSLARGNTQIKQGSRTVITEGRQTAGHLDEVLMNGDL